MNRWSRPWTGSECRPYPPLYTCMRWHLDMSRGQKPMQMEVWAQNQFMGCFENVMEIHWGRKKAFLPSLTSTAVLLSPHWDDERVAQWSTLKSVFSTPTFLVESSVQFDPLFWVIAIAGGVMLTYRAISRKWTALPRTSIQFGLDLIQINHHLNTSPFIEWARSQINSGGYRGGLSVMIISIHLPLSDIWV